MYISTEIASFRKFGDVREILQALKNAGFDAYDASMDNYFEEVLGYDDFRSAAIALRRDADAMGIVCNQSHAPFPTWITGKDSYNEMIFGKIVKSIEVSSILGAKICVVHPNNDASPAENAAFYKRLEPYARQFGIKIGLENMWNSGEDERGFRATEAACSLPDDFCEHLSLLPEDVFVACLDFGHASMFSGQTTCEEMISALGSRLQAVHLQDTDLVHDSHALPYLGDMDWNGILSAWKAAGYTGDITLEACHVAPKLPVELYPALMYLMAQTADHIRQIMQ